MLVSHRMSTTQTPHIWKLNRFKQTKAKYLKTLFGVDEHEVPSCGTLFVLILLHCLQR